MTVAILVRDEPAQAHLRAALSSKAAVVTCAHIDDLLKLVATQRIDIIIVGPWDSRGARVAPALRDIHVRLPSVPVAVYCDLTADALREVVALTKSGADDVIVQGIDDCSQALWSRLLVSLNRRAADQAFAALEPMLSAKVEPIISFCLERAEQGVTVEEVAAALQLHRRTLANRMASAGLPCTSTVISWCRLLVAARLLEDPGRAVEQVAFALEFNSAAALRNMLRRYTGLRPTELRAQGGLQCALELFKKALVSNQARHPSRSTLYRTLPMG